MKTFLTGFLIAVPLSLLVANLIGPGERSEMAEHMREIWIEARERARRVAAEELRSVPGNAGRNLSELLEGERRRTGRG